MKLWLTDLKRTALVAGIAAVLGLAYPVRNAIRSLGTVFPNLKGYAVPVVVVALIVGLLVIAIPLVFLFALYRDDAALRISKRLRHLALLAAVVSGLEASLQLFERIRFLHSDWSQIQRLGGATYVLSSSLGLFSQVTYILFLVAIFHHTSDGLETGVRVSRLLGQVAKLAVVVWSLVLLGIIAAGIYWSIEYPYFQNLAQHNGRELTPLGKDLLQRMRALLQQACLIVPPLIVWKSQRFQSGIADVRAGSIEPLT
jgi:hypothetical protein